MKMKLQYLIYDGTSYLKLKDILNIIETANRLGKGHSEIIKEIKKVEREILEKNEKS